MNHTNKYCQPELINRLTRLELRARNLVEGFINGLHASPFHGRSVEFAQHREYAPGDDVRYVDWRVYAKSDRYYIKQYEEETNLRSHILLDVSGSMGYQPIGGNVEINRLSKRDYAATIAAAISYLQIRQHDEVGLVMFAESVRDRIPPARGWRQWHNIIEILEQNTPTGGTDLKQCLTDMGMDLSQRSMVVVISDFLENWETLQIPLQRLVLPKKSRDVLIVQILDQDEVEFPFSERTMFEGLETPVSLSTEPQMLRKTYLAGLENHLRLVRGFCLDHGIDYLKCSTVDPPETILSGFLAKRSGMCTR